jgi:acetyltransferase-like isoleucine patch superfamily enzyme
VLRKFLLRNGAGVTQSDVDPSKFGRFGAGTVIDGQVDIRNSAQIFLGDSVVIHTGVVMWPRNNRLVVGDGTGINPYAILMGAITIGRLNLIAPHATFAAGNHGMKMNGVPMIRQKGSSEPIVTEDDVWVGANAVITGGVVLRQGSVVAAGAVVTRSTEPYQIVAGVPARVIGDRRNWQDMETPE